MTPLLITFLACSAIDGDTLRCGDERVRLVRIDTPERGEAGFRQAKDALHLEIRGKHVTCYVRKREKYGRLLGDCHNGDGVSLSDKLLARGLAKRYKGKP